MILTERGEFFQSQLLKIIPGNRQGQHLLLQAYLTVNLPPGYNRTASEDLLLEQLLDPINVEIRRSIEAYNLADYLRFVASNEVTDLKSFLGFKSSIHRDATDADLLINLLVVKGLGFSSVICSDDSVRNMYKAYLATAKGLGVRYIDDRDGAFTRFLNCIYSYNLDSELTGLQRFGDAKVEARIRRIVEILYDDFHLTRSEAAWLCATVHESNPRLARDIERIIQNQVRYARFWTTSPVSRMEAAVNNGDAPEGSLLVEHDGKKMALFDAKTAVLAKELLDVAWKTEWYELACGLDLYQRHTLDVRSDEQGSVRTEDISNDVERPNDTALEMSLLYPLTTQNARFSGNSFMIVFPSPFFIRQWLEDKELENHHVHFVMEDAGIEALTREWVLDPRMLTSKKKWIREHVSFSAVRTVDEDGRYQYGEIDAGGYSDILIEDVQKDKNSRRGLLKIPKTVGKNCRLIVLCEDSSMHDPSSLFSSVQKNAKGVLAIPTKTIGTGKKKNIFIADFREDEEADTGNGTLDVYELVRPKREATDRVRRLFVDYAEPISIDSHRFVGNKKPLRKAVKEKRDANKETGKYDSARYVAFCPEVTFKYYEYSSNPPHYVVYFTDGKEEYGRTTNYKAKSPDEFHAWLLNDYIYKKVRVNDGSRNKKNVAANGQYAVDEYNKKGQTYSHWIRDVIGRHYKGSDISLLAFWCFNPDIRSVMKIGDDEYEFLKKLVHSGLGKVYLSELSAEIILEELSENESLEEIDENYAIDLLSRLLSVAVKNGNILHNPLADEDGEDFSARNVTSALARRTFSEAKYRELFNMLKPATVEDVMPENLALLMRLLVGISTPEVAALKWSDFLTIDEYSLQFHALRISKRIASGSNEPQNHSKATCYRIIPLGRYLGQIMEDYYRYLGGEDVNGRFILGSDGISPISTSRISKAFLRYFKKLDVPEIQIRIPKSSGFEEVILTRSFGDLLRENLRFWAIKVAGFNSDEISSLFGTSRVTTFGKYYMDFNNEQSLLYTHEKLNRIEAFLLHGGIQDRIETRIRCLNPEHVLYETYSPIRVDLEFESHGRETVNVSSLFGVRVTEMKPFDGKRGDTV